LKMEKHNVERKVAKPPSGRIGNRRKDEGSGACSTRLYEKGPNSDQGGEKGEKALKISREVTFVIAEERPAVPDVRGSASLRLSKKMREKSKLSFQPTT